MRGSAQGPALLWVLSTCRPQRSLLGSPKASWQLRARARVGCEPLCCPRGPRRRVSIPEAGAEAGECVARASPLTGSLPPGTGELTSPGWCRFRGPWDWPPGPTWYCHLRYGLWGSQGSAGPYRDHLPLPADLGLLGAQTPAAWWPWVWSPKPREGGACSDLSRPLDPLSCPQSLA